MAVADVTAHGRTIMARISQNRLKDHYCVTVSGRLSASDLRRLERACGPALEQHMVALELDASAVTDFDAASESFLRRLAERGARIRRAFDSHPPTRAAAARGRGGRRV